MIDVDRTIASVLVQEVYARRSTGMPVVTCLREVSDWTSKALGIEVTVVAPFEVQYCSISEPPFSTVMYSPSWLLPKSLHTRASNKGSGGVDLNIVPWEVKQTPANSLQRVAVLA